MMIFVYFAYSKHAKRPHIGLEIIVIIRVTISLISCCRMMNSVSAHGVLDTIHSWSWWTLDNIYPTDI